MKRKYIICVNNLSDEQSKEIIKLLKNEGLGWWKWIDNVICAYSSKGILTASDLRKMVKNVSPNERIIVFEINDKSDTWAGVRANDPEKNMFKWMHNNWS